MLDRYACKQLDRILDTGPKDSPSKHVSMFLLVVFPFGRDAPRAARARIMMEAQMQVQPHHARKSSCPRPARP